MPAPQCNTLAELSRTGRQLTDKLVATRAADDTRREIDGWYLAVCGAMSSAQCEVFLSAPRSPLAVQGYPVNDGGYVQTITGRTASLSRQLAAACP